MSDTILFILILAAAIGGIVGIVFFVRNRANEKKRETVISNLPIKMPKAEAFRYTYEWPGCPYVTSVVPVPTKALDLLKQGIEMQITLRPRDWTAYSNPSDYDVALIDPDATNMDGSPALMVNGIQAAGTVIGLRDSSYTPTLIVLPHQQATDWCFNDYLMRSARHEGEHVSIDKNGAQQPNPDVHPQFPGPDDPFVPEFICGGAH